MGRCYILPETGSFALSMDCRALQSPALLICIPTATGWKMEPVFLHRVFVYTYELSVVQDVEAMRAHQLTWLNLTVSYTLEPLTHALRHACDGTACHALSNPCAPGLSA